MYINISAQHYDNNSYFKVVKKVMPTDLKKILYAHNIRMFTRKVKNRKRFSFCHFYSAFKP